MRLLIIGPLDGNIGAAAKIAMSRGAKVTNVDDCAHGLAALRSGLGAELVMIDVKRDVSGFIRSLRRERINVHVVACGIGSDADAAVEAIEAGAQECIPLPPDPELIAAVLEAITEESHAIVYKDPSLAKVLQLAEQVARSDASILITGESGTGKELLARHLHRQSRRANERFVSVNCAAIPENLLESELFGHEKGAFTGAVARRIGKFEEADGGTLLLDEVSEMDPRLQAKLLRAIQEREIDRVGGTRPLKVDIRVIATTNQDLEEQVRQRKFRDDLFFRLNVVTLKLPPLRDRPRDMALLTDHFVQKYSEANGLSTRPVSDAAREKLRTHSWPGNVRELENTVHRAILLATGEVIDEEAILLTRGLRAGMADDIAASTQQLPSDETDAQPGTSGLVGRTVADVERDLIIETLHHCFGNRTHAANILGISIRTLRNKLRQYNEQGIRVPMPGDLDRAAI